MTMPIATNPFSAKVRVGKYMQLALRADNFAALNAVDAEYAPWVSAALLGARVERTGSVYLTLTLPERTLLWDAADAIIERAETTELVERARALKAQIERINARPIRKSD